MGKSNKHPTRNTNIHPETMHAAEKHKPVVLQELASKIYSRVENGHEGTRFLEKERLD